MKYFLSIFFLLILITFITGLYIQSDDENLGNLLVGLSVMALFFVWMPVFIYHRWKDKNFKDYMLSKENIKKMQDYRNGKQ